MSELNQNTGFYRNFIEAMRAKFINIDEFALGIALAMVSGRNMVAWGPAGHAKSEGIQQALSLVQEKQAEIFTLSCGEGMTEERLFGGVDLKVLQTDNVIQYNTDRSFLAARFAVFEEGLDMPDAAALSLKDTLTAKSLRNGRQVVPMQTETIFLLTNHEPKEKAGLDESYKALLERFPLQLRVAWESYTANDYRRLIEHVGGRDEIHIEAGSLAEDLRTAQQLYKEMELSNSVKEILAHLMERAAQSGQPISPRCSIHAVEVVKASAALRGSAEVEGRDLLALRYIPALAAVDNIQKEIREAVAREEADRLLRTQEAQREALQKLWSEAEAALTAGQAEHEALRKALAEANTAESLHKVMAELEEAQRNVATNTAAKQKAIADLEAFESTLTTLGIRSSAATGRPQRPGYQRGVVAAWDHRSGYAQVTLDGGGTAYLMQNQMHKLGRHTLSTGDRLEFTVKAASSGGYRELDNVSYIGR